MKQILSVSVESLVAIDISDEAFNKLGLGEWNKQKELMKAHKKALDKIL
jgi:hypothetical protein